jgi:maltose O-acetyltransferase
LTRTLRIICHPWRYRNRLRFELRRLKLVWKERRKHQRFEVAGSAIFYGLIRCGGRSSVTIGEDNALRLLCAPRSGSGEILIQARSPRSEITIGKGNYFNNNTAIFANERVIIGDRCQIGNQVATYDRDFHEISSATRNRSAGPSQQVLIGNNVWLGSGVVVLKGVTIGDNSVLGAMSVVTGSIPANCVAAGNPAKVIRAIE